jgi:uncharacterized membrane-anchored protein
MGSMGGMGGMGGFGWDRYQEYATIMWQPGPQDSYPVVTTSSSY